MEKVLFATNLKGIKLFKRGKVRDLYEIDDKLLIVATDRISAFDVVLPNGIPYKGKVLTGLSKFWFDFTRNIIDNHLITCDVDSFPDELKQYRDVIRGRSMLVKQTKPIPVECVVRGYISGSAWKEYKKSCSICGINLPANLMESQKLDEPIFTPSTKATTGHDVNITYDELENKVGTELAKLLKEKSIELYLKASDYALKSGIIIADTKFEFGFHEDKVIVIDELLTPDSSRFWPLSEYRPGGPQPSFDKQFVRDYLVSIDWDKTLPAPELPKEVIEKTTDKYLEAYKRIVGKEVQWLKKHSWQ
ncbi:MAG TPA: phosphoribosylaminoimidazolesuccinocarboxamide synthase [bacterium (Candidatus Stahlbacteria)]|nr:phosphoribosylaminoimidazolesuccinocarboxamide synthase [Candidatus Stahlbacteria bacterium]